MHPRFSVLFLIAIISLFSVLLGLATFAADKKTVTLVNTTKKMLCLYADSNNLGCDLAPGATAEVVVPTKVFYNGKTHSTSIFRVTDLGTVKEDKKLATKARSNNKICLKKDFSNDPTVRWEIKEGLQANCLPVIQHQKDYPSR